MLTPHVPEAGLHNVQVEQQAALTIQDRIALIAVNHNMSHAAVNSFPSLFRDLGHNVMVKYSQPIKQYIYNYSTFNFFRFHQESVLNTDVTPIGDASFHHIQSSLDNGILQQLKSGINFNDPTSPCPFPPPFQSVASGTRKRPGPVMDEAHPSDHILAMIHWWLDAFNIFDDPSIVNLTVNQGGRRNHVKHHEALWWEETE